MDPGTGQETWLVEAGGEVLETNFAEMASWIDAGSLLRIDRVRRGNLRWIEAGKVPSLVALFDSAEAGKAARPPMVTTTKLGPAASVGEANPPNSRSGKVATSTTSGADAHVPCSLHEDIPATFVCDTCSNSFCRTCPNSYGGTVKICPFCGAMCRPIAIPQPSLDVAYRTAERPFGFADFGDSLSYPFKFMPSLIMGAIMFMFLSVGQSVAGFGGIFLMWGAIACFLLSNTLTFGILANTVENFSQGKIGLNFMPSFDDFSIWDDVVHPFFLMLGAYISSFGPLIVVIVVAFFIIVAPAQKELTAGSAEPMRMVSKELPYAANAARQSEQVKELLNKNRELANKSRDRVASQTESAESGITTDEGITETGVTSDEPFSDADIQELQNLIQDHRKEQLESVVGPAPETIANERMAMFKQLLARGAILLVAAGICLLWGLFYYPAACAVAGYTRSFGAAINPTVGIDTIRRLGLDYVKILLMGMTLAVASGFVGGILSVIFSPFDLPAIGNIPATAIGALFGFYFSVVFSCVLGFALYRNANKLQLFR